MNSILSLNDAVRVVPLTAIRLFHLRESVYLFPDNDILSHLNLVPFDPDGALLPR